MDPAKRAPPAATFTTYRCASRYINTTIAKTTNTPATARQLRHKKVYRCTWEKEVRSLGEFRDEGEGRPREALLSAEEVASYFAVGKATVYRWCREGRIPCLKIDKHWRMRREDLGEFLKEAEESEGA